MKIALACGTQRGVRVLKKLKELVPDAEIKVFSFLEEDWEPKWRADLIDETGGIYREHQLPKHEFDLLLAVNWRFIIAPEIYSKARLGAFVFHDSLLPAYRGFSPTVWAMINGEKQTGATLFKISEGIDEGGIVDQRIVPIGPNDAISDVMDRVTRAYLSILEFSLPFILSGACSATPQDHSKASYCCRRLPEDNKINWGGSAERIHNLVRAVSHPYPGAWTTLNGRKLIVWKAKPLGVRYIGGVPGRIASIVEGRATVVTGRGLLLIEESTGDPIISLSTSLGT